MPTDVEPGKPWFDKFAGWVSDTVAKAWFFCGCVLLVLLWAPSFWVFSSLDTWQLVINTATTIITFLLVALLQNTQERDMRAINAKLNALASQDPKQMQAAVGLEEREST